MTKKIPNTKNKLKENHRNYLNFSPLTWSKKIKPLFNGIIIGFSHHSYIIFLPIWDATRVLTGVCRLRGSAVHPVQHRADKVQSESSIAELLPLIGTVRHVRTRPVMAPLSCCHRLHRAVATFSQQGAVFTMFTINSWLTHMQPGDMPRLVRHDSLLSIWDNQG